MEIENSKLEMDTWWLAIQTIITNSNYDYRHDFVFWLSENRETWQAFVDKAIQASKRGHKQRFAAKAILEVLRWESFVRDADKTFKVNNNYAPDMARLVMDCKPELKGYFQIRGSVLRKDAIN